MFRNRTEAGLLLAQRFAGRALDDPLVLAIPRGGLATGAALAHELHAELDVVLARKLRAPQQPELAIGAVGEDGTARIDRNAISALRIDESYIEAECARQYAEIVRRERLFRAVRPRAQVEGRSVIVADDGIATGATMIAALEVVRTGRPRELIVAAPVASPDRLAEVARHCDETVCLIVSEGCFAVGRFYVDFTQLTDEEAIELLRRFVSTRQRAM